MATSLSATVVTASVCRLRGIYFRLICKFTQVCTITLVLRIRSSRWA